MRFEGLGLGILLLVVLVSACASTTELLYTDIDARDVIALRLDLDRTQISVSDTLSGTVTLTNLSGSRVAFNPRVMLRTVSVDPTPAAQDSIERHRDSIAGLESHVFERCSGRGAQFSFTVPGIALDLEEEWVLLQPRKTFSRVVSMPYLRGYAADAQVVAVVDFAPIRSTIGKPAKLESVPLYSDTLVVNIR